MVGLGDVQLNAPFVKSDRLVEYDLVHVNFPFIFGRPNIPGTITDVYGGANLGNVKNGCFTNSSVFSAGTSSASSGAALKGMTLSFSANAGNSIFGASDTVQPAGIYGQYLIRYC